MNKSLFIFLIILTNFLTTFSESLNTTIYLDTVTQQYNTNSKIYFLSDISRNLTINDIINEKGFELSRNDVRSFGYSNANFWAKINLEYISNREQYFCINLVASLMTKVHYYLVDSKNKIIKSELTGTEVPFYKRSNTYRNSVFIFKLQKGEKYRLYTLVHNDYGTVNVKLDLYTQSAFDKFYQLETNTLLIFQGLLFFAFMACIALLINFKDKIFLWYGIYILGIIVTRITIYGFTYQFFHPENPEWVPKTKIIFFQIVAIGFINFVYLFFNSNQLNFPRIKKLFLFQTLFYAFIFVISISDISVSMPELSRFLINIMNINYVISILAIFYMLYNGLKINFNAAKYFALAIIPLCTIIVWSILHNNSILIMPTFLYNYPFELGVTIEIIFLFVALIYRYKKIIEDQKTNYETQLEYLFQQKNNEIYVENAEKYSHSKYNDDEIKSKFNELDKFVLENKIYLQTDLNLNKLSELSGIQAHLISQSINQVQNKNFFDYINTYRIEKAIELFQNPKYDNFSAEGIGYECGFNTKATFYSAFKKVVGSSPAEYRKNRQN